MSASMTPCPTCGGKGLVPDAMTGQAYINYGMYRCQSCAGTGKALGVSAFSPQIVTEQAMTEKLQAQEDRYHYAVEVFVQDGDGYISAGEVAWSMTRSGAEQMAQEMLDKRWVPSKRPLSGDWVKFVVTESREVSVARFCYSPPSEKRGLDLTNEQLEELTRHFERVKPLTEDERQRAQAALREATSKFRMRG